MKLCVERYLKIKKPLLFDINKEEPAFIQMNSIGFKIWGIETQVFHGIVVEHCPFSVTSSIKSGEIFY